MDLELLEDDPTLLLLMGYAMGNVKMALESCWRIYDIICDVCNVKMDLELLEDDPTLLLLMGYAMVARATSRWLWRAVGGYVISLQLIFVRATSRWLWRAVGGYVISLLLMDKVKMALELLGGYMT
eukprot:g3267.t1